MVPVVGDLKKNQSIKNHKKDQIPKSCRVRPMTSWTRFRPSVRVPEEQVCKHRDLLVIRTKT